MQLQIKVIWCALAPFKCFMDFKSLKVRFSWKLTIFFVDLSFPTSYLMSNNLVSLTLVNIMMRASRELWILPHVFLQLQKTFLHSCRDGTLMGCWIIWLQLKLTEVSAWFLRHLHHLKSHSKIASFLRWDNRDRCWDVDHRQCINSQPSYLHRLLYFSA